MGETCKHFIGDELKESQSTEGLEVTNPAWYALSPWAAYSECLASGSVGIAGR